MKCDCCLKRKKLFESFAAVKTENGKLNLCVDCNDLAYKLRDDAKEGNKDKFNKHLEELEKRCKKAKPIFEDWKKSFLADLYKCFPSEESTADNEKCQP